MTVSAFFTLAGLLCLVVLISGIGIYVLLKRKQPSAAVIPEEVCTMDIPEVMAPKLEIRIPAEWRHNNIEGPGFYVHSFGLPDDQGNVTIYIGQNPSIKKGVASQKKVKHVGGKKVEFFIEEADGKVISQAIVRDFFDQTGHDTISALLLHIMIVEQKSGFTNKAFQALDTLKIRE